MDKAKVKPLDLAILLRDAFLAGRSPIDHGPDYTRYVRADIVERLADALYAQVYEHGAVTSDAYALIDEFSQKGDQ